MLTTIYLIVAGVPPQIRVPRLAHWPIFGSLDLLCITKTGKALLEMIYDHKPCNTGTYKVEPRNGKKLGLQDSPLNPSYNSEVLSCQTLRFKMKMFLNSNLLSQHNPCIKGVFISSIDWFNCPNSYLRQLWIHFNFQITKLSHNHREMIINSLNYRINVFLSLK